MDERSASISPHEFYARRGTARSPIVVDLGRENVLSADGVLIVGTIRGSHEQQPQQMAFDHLATIVRSFLVISCSGVKGCWLFHLASRRIFGKTVKC